MPYARRVSRPTDLLAWKPVAPLRLGTKCSCSRGTYLTTEFGRPFTSNGFGNRFRKWCDEAGLTHCTAHGLRKAGATIAADNGATEFELMAIFGWETPKEAARYTRKANRKRTAARAMHLLSPDQKVNNNGAPFGAQNGSPPKNETKSK